jgi:hypothetical protein
MKTMLVVWTSVAALMAAAPIGKAHAEDLPAFAECKGKAIELYTSKSIGVLEFADAPACCSAVCSPCSASGERDGDASPGSRAPTCASARDSSTCGRSAAS